MPFSLLATLATNPVIPRPLSDYADPAGAGLWSLLAHRIQADPLNAVATGIFLLAILHTFAASRFQHWSHRVNAAHLKAIGRSNRTSDHNEDGIADPVSFKGQVLHFLGEVEAVFGLWAIALLVAISATHGRDAATDYLSHRVNFTEPMFVFVIMALAGTRPVLRFAEQCLAKLAGLGGHRVGAWWLSVLIVAPLLGSFITEPAAMTIAALLLSKQFYARNPSPRLAYATIGLLFVNVSVGGTLTHFAAPPVLMVAGPWNWDTAFMLEHVGWKALVGILAGTTLFYLVFRRELRSLDRTARPEAADHDERRAPIPAWITLVHLLFMGFCVATAHHPPFFLGAFLFFLAFSQATAHHQSRLELRAPLLVGFFLAGLVIHGGLQGWWIEPVLKSLDEASLFAGAAVLTAFNDNAAITYLATLVPDFTEPLKYAVVTGAVTGGGLTVIANAPNPAGQNILQKHFPTGVKPLGLFLGALVPTLVISAVFFLFR
ncbi:MAG: putative Na+/H+ antiporter [Opitutaceae bacterium]|nr:putative Na+/H+ antiporter [Opitutaceae bacterium]